MTTREANQKLANDLKLVVADAEELIKATAGQAGEKLSHLRARLAKAIESAKVSCQGLEQKTVAAAKATDHAVREHPYQAVGIAFGIGLVAGVLLRRK